MWNNINQVEWFASAIGTFRAICESESVFRCIFGLRVEHIGDFHVKSAAVRSSWLRVAPAAAGSVPSYRILTRRAALQQGSPSFQRSSRCFLSKSTGFARRCFCVAFRTASAMASHAAMLFISSFVTPIVVHCIVASAFDRRESRIRANSPWCAKSL